MKTRTVYVTGASAGLGQAIMARKAFEGQFEKPDREKNCDGNLLHPVGEFHKTEGRFASRQKNRVFWRHD
jgi:hypothetical protein